MRTPQSHTAPENSPSQSTLEDLRIPVQAKLAAAWTSFMFLYIYVDYLALYKPGFLDDLLAGNVHEFDTGPTFVAIALTLMAIPILMILLSTTLPARVNRTINLVVATLYIPVSIFNAAGRPGPTPTSTASPSDSRCCSWPSSCAPPGPGHAATHHRRSWQPASTASRPAGRSRRDCPPRARPSFARATRGHGPFSGDLVVMPVWRCSGIAQKGVA